MLGLGPGALKYSSWRRQQPELPQAESVWGAQARLVLFGGVLGCSSCPCTRAAIQGLGEGQF